MEKSIIIIAMWLGPAFACWATEVPEVAFAFGCSVLGTLIIYTFPQLP